LFVVFNSKRNGKKTFFENADCKFNAFLFLSFLLILQPPKTTTAAPAAKPAAKKTGAAPKKGPMKKTKTALQANPLFPSRARSSRIGGDLRVSDFSFFNLLFVQNNNSLLVSRFHSQKLRTYLDLFVGQNTSDFSVNERS
jgi:hypothetical protein